MAKYGYYKQRAAAFGKPVLIQEFEGSGIRQGGKPEVVSIYRDGPNETRQEVATIHLNKGEWVALVESALAQAIS